MKTVTRTRKVKTDRRDARALQEACLLGAYRPRPSAVRRAAACAGRLAVRDALVRTRTGYQGGERFLKSEYLVFLGQL